MRGWRVCFKFKVVKFQPQKHLSIWKAEKHRCSCVSFIAYGRITHAHVSLFYAIKWSLIRIKYTICNEINPDSLTFSQMFMLFLVLYIAKWNKKRTFHTFDNRLWSIIMIIISIAHPLDAHHELYQNWFPRNAKLQRFPFICNKVYRPEHA